MSKPKVAIAWFDTCSGCIVSLLDMDERIIGVTEAVDFMRCPLTDIKEFTPVDVGIIDGAIGNDEQEEQVKELRGKCKYLMALGDCACFGGIASMRNMFDKKDVIQTAYVETESTAAEKPPSFADSVPKLSEKVVPVGEIVKVDCYVPGCPPGADAIYYAITELLQGRISVLPSEMYKQEKGIV